MNIGSNMFYSINCVVSQGVNTTTELKIIKSSLLYGLEKWRKRNVLIIYEELMLLKSSMETVISEEKAWKYCNHIIIIIIYYVILL